MCYYVLFNKDGDGLPLSDSQLVGLKRNAEKLFICFCLMLWLYSKLPLAGYEIFITPTAGL